MLVCLSEILLVRARLLDSDFTSLEYASTRSAVKLLIVFVNLEIIPTVKFSRLSITMIVS